MIGKWHMDSYTEIRDGFDYWAVFEGQGSRTNVTLNVQNTGGPTNLVNHTGYTTAILTDYAVDFIND
jgi:hypothetical protein